MVVLVPAPARTLTVELALPSLMVAGNTFVVVSLPVLSLPVSVSDETRTIFLHDIAAVAAGGNGQYQSPLSPVTVTLAPCFKEATMPEEVLGCARRFSVEELEESLDAPLFCSVAVLPGLCAARALSLGAAVSVPAVATAEAAT